MLCSMTAFAHVQSRGDRGGVEWEIRSVNNRYLDVNVRLPEDLRGLDPKVRERVGARLGRGKVDCTLRALPGLDSSGGLPVDHDLAARVAHAARAVAELLPEPAPINPVDVLRWPGVVQAPAPDPEHAGHAALELLDRALDELIGMREREGGRIGAVIRERLDALAAEAPRLRGMLPAIVQAFRERMRARLADPRPEPRRGPHRAGDRPSSRNAWTWRRSSTGSKRTSRRSGRPSTDPDRWAGASTS